MPLRPLGDSLGQWRARREFGQRLAAAGVVNAANEIGADWPTRRGGPFRTLSFRGGTLTVQIPNASARYLLQPELPAIIVAINERLGRQAIEAIAFRLYRPE